jgi:DNA-binding response OmpR family regulator
MIYVADGNAEFVLKTRRMLYLLGIPSIGGSFRMAAYYIKNGLCDAVFLPRPISEKRPKYFCRSIRSHFPHIPTVMLADHEYDGQSLKDPADLVVRAPFSPSSALRRIFSFLSEKCCKNLGALHVGSLTHKVTNGGFYFDGEFIRLTDAQTSILHIMIDRFPSPLPPKTLLKLSADPRKSPKLCTLSPQICRLNKRFSEQFGFRPIAYHPLLGYYLSIP